MGDWYLAGVQRKIWSIWNQQLKDVSTYLVTVRFTILSDGKLDNVEVVKSSGIAVLDLAAQRAVYSAAPFGPLPKTYGTDRITIQATFKPTT
jgi:TonB family protein